MVRTPAEVNAALAGATLVAPFARFKVSTAVFSEERSSCCPWVLAAMSGVQVVRKSPRLIETGVWPDIARLVQSSPFGEEDYLTVAFQSVPSDHPLKLTMSQPDLCLLEGQTYGFPTMITRLISSLPCRSAKRPRTSGSPSRDPKGLHAIAHPIYPGYGNTDCSCGPARCETLPPYASPTSWPNILTRLPKPFRSLSHLSCNYPSTYFPNSGSFVSGVN